MGWAFLVTVVLVVVALLALDQSRVNAENRLRKLESEIRSARVTVDGDEHLTLNGRISYNVERERELRKLVFAIDKRLADAVNAGDVALGEVNSRIANADRQRVQDNATAAGAARKDFDALYNHIKLLADKLNVEFDIELIKREQVVGNKLVLRKKPRTRK